CGSPMYGTKVKGVRVYRCASYMSYGQCAPRTVREDLILPLLVQLIQQRFLDPAALDALREELREQQRATDTRDEVDRLTKRVAALEKKIREGERRLVEIDHDMLEGAKSRIRELKREHETALAHLAQVSSRKSPAEAVDALVDKLKQLPKVMKSADP